MRIVFDIYNAPEQGLPASGIFLTDLTIEIARRNNLHSFVYLITGKHFPEIGNLPDNVSIRYINNIFSKWLCKKFWYKYILTKELSRLKADLFVTADNLFLSRTPIPVCLFLIHKMEELRNGAPRKKNESVIKKLDDIIQYANTLVTFSNSDKQLVQTQLRSTATNIQAILPKPVETPKLKWTEKEMVKVDFAGGVEYFLFAGDLHERCNLIELLKAFSLFKKWQQSNMRLVIAGSKTGWTDQFVKQLASFKYRNEVNLLIDPSKETLQKIIAGSYAFVYPAIYDNFPIYILQAMQAGVPVLSSPVQVCKEWCGDNIIYAETNNSAGFAKIMQLIYRDERLRSDFIDAAKKHVSTRYKNDLAETCMKFFEKSVAK